MSAEKITLYKLGFIDILMTFATSGIWLLFVLWLNGVEVDAPQGDA